MSYPTRFDANGVEYLDVPLDGLPPDYPKYILRLSYLHHTMTANFYAACIILTVVTLTCVVLRCKARQRTKQFGWDDFTIVLSWLFYFALNLCTIIFIYRAGFGTHVFVITEEQENLFWGAAVLVVQLLYLFTMFLVKMSILFLYHRLFGVSQRFRYVIYGTIVVYVLLYIALIICAVLSSSMANWYLVPRISALISGVSNLITDVIVLFLPARMVWRLKVDWQTKAKLIALFGLGLLVCVSSLVRIIFLENFVGMDEIYESSRIIIWTVVECGLTITAACLPIVRQLFHAPPPSTSDRTPSTYWYSRRKASSGPQNSSTSRIRNRKQRGGWWSTRSHDESQEEIVQIDEMPGKSSQSKDEEMNWASIELTPREPDGSGTQTKHG